ncbi:MAG: cation:proton antiporter subunit C [Pseudomonadota bacterium]
MLEFVLERYNYWIVIILMMTGLYIVFSRGNLVKKLVGLNLFQTSVFIFYITLGKVAGGTAPILIGGHGGGHGEDQGGAHGEGVQNGGSYGSDAAHANDLASPVDGAQDAEPAAHGDGAGATYEAAADHGNDAGHAAANAAHGAAEVLYSNPLPHVLILTAIVVGVATTAVGLSLAVRIREAYGTVEEDELDAMDYEAEFGVPEPEGARS